MTLPKPLFVATTVLPLTMSILLAGCASEGGQDDKASTSTAELTKESNGQGTASVVTFSPGITDEVDASELSRRLIAVLAPNQRIDTLDVSTRSPSTQDRRFDVGVKGNPSLRARYELAEDEVEAYELISRNRDPKAPTLALPEATAVFERTLTALETAGMVVRDRLAIDATAVRQRRAGQALEGQPATEWTEEYVYFVPLSVEGARVGTHSEEYGVTINVHRSGKVRRIAISGQALAARRPGAMAQVRSEVRAIRGEADAAVWVARQYSQARVRPLGLRYLVSSDKGAMEVSPEELFEVVPTFVNSENGSSVEGKKMTLSYSTNLTSSEPQLWPRPGAQAPGYDAQVQRR